MRVCFFRKNRLSLPGIEHNVLLGQGDTCGFEVGKGAHDITRRHVPPGVIIPANHDNAGVMALTRNEQVV